MHFVVVGEGKRFAEKLVARTRKKTKGIIHKNIVGVFWEGGSIATQLNQDDALTSLLKEVLLEEEEIYVEPTDNCVRIHGRWKPQHKLEISKNALRAYNTIASHVKKCISETATSKT